MRMAMPDLPKEIADIVTRIEKFVTGESLWHDGAHLLVAVSGGPDSVLLLYLLQQLFAPRQQLRLTVGHVNHGLRPAANTDAEFVAALAEQYGLAYRGSQVDVRARVAERGESVEEAARILRYAALEEQARAVGAGMIVTGHTADDQAETVLMRLLRGSGLTGLAGIPVQRGKIVRPLLTVWRREILACLAYFSLPYCVDDSNASTRFTRNLLRLELLPYLEENYAPRLRERLRQLAELAGEDEQMLEQLAGEAFRRLVHPLPGGLMVFHDNDLPRALRRRLFRQALAEVRGSLRDIHYQHIAALEALPLHGEVHLPGARVLHEAQGYAFLPADTSCTVDQGIAEQALPVPGRCCLLEAGCCLQSELLAACPPLRGGDEAVIDAGALRGALSLRSWQPGDRYRPYGAPGTRTLQDIFVDARVPRRLRTRIPVICDDDGIVWLAGYRPADRVKVIPESTVYLRLAIEWEYHPWTSPPLPAAR